MSSGGSVGLEGSLHVWERENVLRPAMRYILERGDGRGGFLLLCFSPQHVHTRDQQKRNSPDTELQLGHTTHARKAFRGHLRLREISCWVPQRDGGELIFLFSRSQIKGGLGEKGVVRLSSRSYYRLFHGSFFFFFFGSWGRRISELFRSEGFFLPWVKNAKLVLLSCF